MTILAINSSSRSESNTSDMLGILLRDISAEYISLRKFEINPVADQRHSSKKWQTKVDDYPTLINTLVNSDIVVFATPIYWYSISGLLKNFIDRWSESLATDPEFRKKVFGKKIYVLLVGDDLPKIKAMPIIKQFEYICDFLDWDLIDYVITTANKPHSLNMNDDSIRKLTMLNANLKVVTDND